MNEKKMYRLGVIIACGLFLNAFVSSLQYLPAVAAYARPDTKKPAVKPAPVYLCNLNGVPLTTVYSEVGEGSRATVAYTLSTVDAGVKSKEPMPVSLYLPNGNGTVYPFPVPLPVRTVNP